MEQPEAVISVLLTLTCWVKGGSGCSKRRGLMAPVIRLSLEGSQQKGEKRMSRKWSPVPALTATDKPRMNPENNPLHMAVRSHGQLLRNRL